MSLARQSEAEVCYLCNAKTIKEFEHWQVVNNEYPYDRIADTHHIISLKRHTSEANLTRKEKVEFEQKVKIYLHRHYDMIFENTIRSKSIPGHHHLHAIDLKHLDIIKAKLESIPLSTLHS